MVQPTQKFHDSWIIKIYLHSFTNNELEISNLAASTTLGGLVRYWNFSFTISELVQVNPDNSLAEWVNLELYYAIENTANQSYVA